MTFDRITGNHMKAPRTTDQRADNKAVAATTISVRIGKPVGVGSTAPALTTTSQGDAMADAIQDLPGEIWKPVAGFEGMYDVSNEGRVRSHRWGARLIKGQKSTRNGHLKVKLWRNGAATPYRYVHRMVLEWPEVQA